MPSRQASGSREGTDTSIHVLRSMQETLALQEFDARVEAVLALTQPTEAEPEAASKAAKTRIDQTVKVCSFSTAPTQLWHLCKPMN